MPKRNATSRWSLRRSVKKSVEKQMVYINESLWHRSDDEFNTCDSNEVPRSSVEAQDFHLSDTDDSTSNDEDTSSCDSFSSNSTASSISDDSLLDPERDCFVAESQNNLTSETLAGKVKNWVLRHNISHSALRDILAILKDENLSLPSDPRTLLQTRAAREFKDAPVPLPGGHYFHFGLKAMLKNYLHSTPSSEKSITLQVNVDGLPLIKSTRDQSWPILARIMHPYKSVVFTIRIFCGKSKPSNLDFLSQFINELKDILKNGYFFTDVVYKMSVYFSANAPARQLLKGITSHSGYYSCEKCVTKGEYILNRVSFPELNANLRTDDSFRNMIDLRHHVSLSPLNSFFNMVSGFPYDYMHLVCLGVMKRLLQLWVNGRCKIEKSKLTDLSKKLVMVKSLYS